MVLVYATPGCPGCTLTCRHLEKCGLDYQKIDITTDPQAAAAARALGHSSVPVVVAGDQHWSGYRPDRIMALVGR